MIMYILSHVSLKVKDKPTISSGTHEIRNSL